MLTPEKRPRERLLHAVLYELCAMVLLVPLGSLVLNVSLSHVGILGLILSLLAMSWNMLFNALFERVEKHYHLTRTPLLRTAHAIGFEGGLLLLAIPPVAWWMGISYWQALLLDGAIFLFFLPYTYAFNWCYDHGRMRLLARQQAGCGQP